MLVGRTKFTLDWCHGLVLLQKFSRTEIGCLAGIVNVANSSVVVNHAQLVGSEDVTITVP